MSFFNRDNHLTAVQTAPRRTVVPRYQIRENTDAFVITAHVPGVERSSVETTVEGEHLTVVARRSNPVPAEWTALHRESSQADYQLVLELDHRVNREGVQAELRQGVLTLTVPKAEKVKPRQIEIKG
jgi:HSP20 family molecular chaperone IbpA